MIEESYFTTIYNKLGAGTDVKKMCIEGSVAVRKGESKVTLRHNLTFRE